MEEALHSDGGGVSCYQTKGKFGAKKATKLQTSSYLGSLELRLNDHT